MRYSYRSSSQIIWSDVNGLPLTVATRTPSLPTSRTRVSPCSHLPNRERFEPHTPFFTTTSATFHESTRATLIVSSQFLCDAASWTPDMRHPNEPSAYHRHSSTHLQE